MSNHLAIAQWLRSTRRPSSSWPKSLRQN
jgi:hypothetical protein